MRKDITYRLALGVLLAALLCSLAACGPTLNQLKPQKTVTVSKQFQQQSTPIPTIPPYRCGAWASTNIPGTYSLIQIYAHLTEDSVTSLSGVSAQAVAHFKSGDVPLGDQPTSDSNGYVVFNLPLQGRQPSLVPATVDVTFETPDKPTTCSAFFTPQ